MSKNTLIAVFVVILLVGVGWYLMRPKTSSAPVTTQPSAAPAETPSESPSASEGATMKVSEITVSGTDYAFTPAKLSVKKGDKIKLVFQNNGKYPHNLVIDELKVTTKTINAGQTDTVEFTVDQAGSYSMYCSVDSHRQKGMEGTVSVQ